MITKLNWTPNSFSDFAISVTSLLPVIVSMLPKSLLSEDSFASPAVAQNEQVHVRGIEPVRIIPMFSKECEWNRYSTHLLKAPAKIGALYASLYL